MEFQRHSRNNRALGWHFHSQGRADTDLWATHSFPVSPSTNWAPVDRGEQRLVCAGRLGSVREVRFWGAAGSRTLPREVAPIIKDPPALEQSPFCPSLPAGAKRSFPNEPPRKGLVVQTLPVLGEERAGDCTSLLPLAPAVSGAGAGPAGQVQPPAE